MLFSAGGSSGGGGLISASGIVSPPSPSPPPAVRHSPRPRLPPPPSRNRGHPRRCRPHPAASGAAASGRQWASCPLWRRHPAAEPPPPSTSSWAKWRPAAAASCRDPCWRGSAPAAAALRGSSSAPFAACRVRSRGDQSGRKPRYLASSVFSGAAGSRLRLPGILPISAAASCRRLRTALGVRPIPRPDRLAEPLSGITRPSEVQLIFGTQIFFHTFDQHRCRSSKKSSLPQNQFAARVKLAIRIPTEKVISRP